MRILLYYATSRHEQSIFYNSLERIMLQLEIMDCLCVNAVMGKLVALKAVSHLRQLFQVYNKYKAH